MERLCSAGGTAERCFGYSAKGRVETHGKPGNPARACRCTLANDLVYVAEYLERVWSPSARGIPFGEHHSWTAPRHQDIPAMEEWLGAAGHGEVYYNQK